MKLRPETRRRARALQLLYAWEIQARPPMAEIAAEAQRLCSAQRLPALEQAAALATAVAAEWESLDQRSAQAAEHWRLERMAVVERNILRLNSVNFGGMREYFRRPVTSSLCMYIIEYEK